MDFNQLVLLVVVLFVLFLLSELFDRRKSNRGSRGEKIINNLLGNKLSLKKYHLIRDVTLPLDDFGTTQIDHIVISRFGIFVIETKNMQGMIVGDEDIPTWVQILGKRKYQFQSPLRQNYKHLVVLKKLLNKERIRTRKLVDKEIHRVHSIVVFPDNKTKFKHTMPDNVVKKGKLLSYIRSHRTIVYSEKEVNIIIKAINKNRLRRGWATNRKHVAYLKNKHKNKGK